VAPHERTRRVDSRRRRRKARRLAQHREHALGGGVRYRARHFRQLSPLTRGIGALREIPVMRKGPARIDRRGFARGLAVVYVVAGLALVPSLSGCGYNDVIERDEDVKGAWAEVQNQYKRRSDLVPNLVNVVKGNAAFEKETLEKVVEARSKVAGLKVDAS